MNKFFSPARLKTALRRDDATFFIFSVNIEQSTSNVERPIIKEEFTAEIVLWQEPESDLENRLCLRFIEKKGLTGCSRLHAVWRLQ